jgi:hypothetical protein
MGVAGREDEHVEDQADETTEDEGESQIEGGEGGEEQEEDEVVVQIGNEEPPASEEDSKPAPQWVKDLRERQKALARENAELKQKLGTSHTVQKPPTLPERPKLADFDFDEEKHQEAVDAWHATKREVEAHEANQANAVKQAQERVRTIDENYAKSKVALKVKDFDDAELEVAGQLSDVQQALLKSGADNPGLVVYALGKSPAKLREMASIKDPVKFAVAVGKLETEVKVTKRTSTKPAPETTLRSGSSSATTGSATLERLRAEADKTGDRSKVAAFLKQQRSSGK